MPKLRDRLWLWGHPTNSVGGRYDVKGSSSMSPVEGATYLGVENIYFVPWVHAMDLRQSCLAARHLREIGWSVETGRIGGERNIDAIADEITQLRHHAEGYSNFTRVVWDDFFHDPSTESTLLPERFASLTPEHMREFRDLLAREPHPLSMWMVLYASQLQPLAQPYIDQFDGVSLWFWCESEVKQFEQRYAEFLSMTQGRRRQVGCYLFNFGENKEADPAAVTWQLDRLLPAVQSGEIEGIILHTNAVADFGFSAVAAARDWISEHGDIELSVDMVAHS